MSPPERPLNATEQAIALMEPACGLLGHVCASLGEAGTVSIAISLKRIADVMDGTLAGVCVTETIFGGRS